MSLLDSNLEKIFECNPDNYIIFVKESSSISICLQVFFEKYHLNYQIVNICNNQRAEFLNFLESKNFLEDGERNPYPVIIHQHKRIQTHSGERSHTTGDWSITLSYKS